MPILDSGIQLKQQALTGTAQQAISIAVEQVALNACQSW
jgi:hypothetical protein